MARQKSRSSGAGARSRRRAVSLAEFLSVPVGVTALQPSVDADTGEIIIPGGAAGASSVSQPSARRKEARRREMRRYLREELLADPEGFFLRLINSIGFSIGQFFKWFASFSRFLLLPFTAMVVLATAIVLSTCTLGLCVSLDGQVIGYVSDSSVYDTAKLAVEAEYTDRLGDAFRMEQAPTYSLRLIARDRIVDESELEQTIANICETAAGRSYGLFVDGALIGTYHNDDAIYELLEGIKYPYMSGAYGESIVFANDVQIIQDIYSDQFEMSIAQLRARLLCGDSVADYAVSEEDSVGSICEKFGLSDTVFYLINPELASQELAAGMSVTVGANTPLLSVQVSRTVTYDEEIPFETISRSSADHWAGSRTVITPGVPGTKRVTAQVLVIDGVEVSRNILSETTVSEPTSQYVLVGTKDIKVEGYYIWPIGGDGGSVSSPYGANRGDHYHGGLDIAASSGTPIYAANAGVVTVSGWSSGGYGYNVMIDHGNGVTTRYCHCSRTAVDVGQMVYQGQVIAYVGSTGNSTGPHCHFEMEVNGMRVNPSNYVS